MNIRQKVTWDDVSDVMTVDDVALVMAEDPKTVYRKARTGEYPRMNTSNLRFDKETLRAHVNQSGSLKTEKKQKVNGFSLAKKRVELCL
jgi:adenylylsulfate kinase-like enzyme